MLRLLILRLFKVVDAEVVEIVDAEDDAKVVEIVDAENDAEVVEIVDAEVDAKIVIKNCIKRGYMTMVANSKVFDSLLNGEKNL